MAVFTSESVMGILENFFSMSLVCWERLASTSGFLHSQTTVCSFPFTATWHCSPVIINIYSTIYDVLHIQHKIYMHSAQRPLKLQTLKTESWITKIILFKTFNNIPFSEISQPHTHNMSAIWLPRMFVLNKLSIASHPVRPVSLLYSCLFCQRLKRFMFLLILFQLFQSRLKASTNELVQWTLALCKQGKCHNHFITSFGTDLQEM